jgi:UDP-glucose 4-epimerase
MHYVVTGGAGMIGSHIAKHLCGTSHTVTVVDDLSRGKMSNLDNVRDKIEFVNADITDYDAVCKHLGGGSDGIFHQAALAYVPESFERAFDYHRVNVAGTDNVFKIALKTRTRVVFASSGSVYGDTTSTRPIRETYPRDPASPYAWTKCRGEMMAARYCKAGARIVLLRYFNVAGPGRDLKYAGAISKMAHSVASGSPPRIFGDGNQIRDFVHVDDVVRANVAAMESDIPYGFFNIGSGAGVSIGNLARLVVKIAGACMEPVHDTSQPDGGGANVASVKKARFYLDWVPRVTLEECVQKILATFSFSGAQQMCSGKEKEI